MIIYSLIGIPLNIFLITTIGQLISKDLARLIRLIERRILKKKELKNIEDKTSFLLACIFVLWWWAGAALARKKMNWTWVDCFYYAFVKLSTIGYGDKVIKFDEGDRLYGELLSWYACIGLAIAAGFFNAISKAMQKEANISPDVDFEEEEFVELKS